MKLITAIIFVLVTGLVHGQQLQVKASTIIKKNSPAVNAQVFMGASLTGSINVGHTLYTAFLQANNNIDPQGRIIIAEVYNYICVKSKSQQGKTDFYLTNKEDADVSYTMQNGNINFTVNGLQPGQYAIVVSIKKIPAAYRSIKVSDYCKINGQFVNAALLNCNAKIRIAGCLEYGIATIDTRADRQVNFTTSYVTADGLQNVSLLSDIGDAISDAVDFVKNTIADAAGFVVNATGAIIVTVGTTVTTLAQSGELPSFRIISEDEYNWVKNKLFADARLPPRNNIIITNLMSFKRRAYVIPGAGNYILMNLGTSARNPVTATTSAYTYPGSLFIHEFTHVWQIYNNNWHTSWSEGIKNQWEATVLGDGAAVYTPDTTKSWSSQNFEQQASISNICFVHVYKDAGNEKVNNRCGWYERTIVQHIRNGREFPFEKFFYRKTVLPLSGNTVIGGSIEWNSLKSVYPAAAEPNQVFEVIATAPSIKMEKVSGCNGSSVSSYYTQPAVLQHAVVHIYKPYSVAAASPVTLHSLQRSEFVVENLPDNVPVSVQVKPIINFTPGTMSNNAASGKTVFRSWVEPEEPLLATIKTKLNYKLQSGYAPVAPYNKVVVKQQNVSTPASDGPADKVKIDKSPGTIIKTPLPGINKPAITAPVGVIKTKQ